MNVQIDTQLPFPLRGEVISKGHREYESFLDELEEPDLLDPVYVLDQDSRTRLAQYEISKVGREVDPQYPWNWRRPNRYFDHRDLDDHEIVRWLNELPIRPSQLLFMGGTYVLTFRMLIKCFFNISMWVGSDIEVMDHTYQWMLNIGHEETLSFFVRE